MASAEEPGTEEEKTLDEAGFCPFGILFMSVNILIDTIFLTVDCSLIPGCNSGLTDNVPDFIFMAIGVGGGSVLSRALGAKIMKKAKTTFANQIMMTFILASLFVVLASFQF
jgi:Na+-driven multidrug efflux pump